MSLTGFANYSSGRPFNITTGLDNNGDSIFTDRPAFATDENPDAVRTPFGVFDPTPNAKDPLAPRNYGREGAVIDVDLRISKVVAFSAATQFIVALDVDNVLNIANRTGVVGVLTSPAFGTPRRAAAPRRVTLSTDWSF